LCEKIKISFEKNLFPLESKIALSNIDLVSTASDLSKTGDSQSSLFIFSAESLPTTFCSTALTRTRWVQMTIMHFHAQSNAAVI